MKASEWWGSILFAFVVLHLGLLITSCGNRMPPPGGPVDETSPRIVSLYPDSNATGVAQGAIVRINFDEEVITAGGREGVFLLPVHHSLKVKYGLDYIELRPEGGFYPGCTYCVHLSEEIVDLRGNPLKEPLSYCFSTGDSIHSGTITGLVEFTEDLGRRIYFQATHLPDSLTYKIGVDPGVSFSLNHLPRGVYHLLVFSDVGRDGWYDPDEDPGDEKEGELDGGVLEVNFHLESQD